MSIKHICPECRAAIPQMFHEPWCKRRKLPLSRRGLLWISYFAVALLWIALTILWVIEAGRPYP